MNTAAVDPIVKAVLYEGHILYPYRPSSIKNRKRFTFGRVYPRAYSRQENGKEPCTMTTECLLRSDAAEGDVPPMVEIAVRFLQPIERQVIDSSGRKVDRLSIDGELYQSWQEVEERSVDLPPLRVAAGAHRELPFSFAAAIDRRPIGAQGAPAGFVERRYATVAGTLEVSVDAVDESVFRLRALISNESTVSDALVGIQEEVLLRTFASTHTILHVRGGQFLSMTDPPEDYTRAAAVCENGGTWPVLVGDPDCRDTLLSSPIILYDFPQIAPESAGDLFDGTEIDELLTLRVMTLTDDEKSEMRDADTFARSILQRTEGMDGDDLFGMHGTLRGLKELSIQVPPKYVDIEGRRLTVGDHVRIRPQKMTDVMDVALTGRAAEIESIEQDFEGRIHLALVVDDDPGKDLGKLRQPGHRFFYGLEDVELLNIEGP